MTNLKMKFRPWTEKEVALLDNEDLSNIDIASMTERRIVEVGLMALRLGKGTRMNNKSMSTKVRSYLRTMMKQDGGCAYVAAVALSRTLIGVRSTAGRMRSSNPKLKPLGNKPEKLKDLGLKPTQVIVMGEPACYWIGEKELPIVKPVEEYKLEQEIDGVEPAPWHDEPETGLEQLAKRAEARTALPEMLSTKIRVLNAINNESRDDMDLLESLVTAELARKLPGVIAV